ncbi:MAG: phosphoribosyltransferase family protein [Candidatus Jordarchaeales archaeon]
MSNGKEALKKLILEKGVVRGRPIFISSTRMSTFYFNLRPILFSYEGSRLVAAVLLPMIKELEVDCIGGVEDSSVPIVMALCVLNGYNGFYVREKAKKYGLQEQIEGNLGKKAVLVDDVATSGLTLLNVARIVRARGCEVKHAVVIVDMLEGAKEKLASEGISLRSVFTREDFKEIK